MRSKTVIVFVLCALSICTSLVAQDLLDWPLDTVKGEEVYRYKVEKSIGLYRVGVNFNVTQADIIRLNPQLNERGLHYGEILLIPTGRPVVKPSKAEHPKAEEPQKVEVTKKEQPKVEEPKIEEPKVLRSDTVVIPQDSITVASDTIIALPDTATDGRELIELALMLPFESKHTKRGNNADRMLEFYQGVLLALKDMQNDSVRFRIRVYDTERSERRVNALCDSTELDNVKGVIGLVYPIQIERMASWCADRQVPLLLPFSTDDRMDDKPFVLQFNSNDNQQADSICTWIEQRDVHCVAVEVREADMTNYARTMRKRMQAHRIRYSAMPLRDLINDSADYVLDREKENIILLHSDKYQHVRMLIPHLEKLQSDGYRIRIISQYSWLKEELDIPQVYTSLFTSVASRDNYESEWSTYFNTEHVSFTPRYDLLGYDLMQALVAWLRGEKKHHGLQSDIHWEQAGEGGWQNCGIKVKMEK